MAIAASVSGDEGNEGHENDVIMPGFRFHPTEEELIEFYLRRKVEGKHFNVELITYLDLYCYDPWELPELAAIGEKEWFFYVPRGRKYRNGNRPNRVTTSGYWKATGADRMVRSENLRPIGLKKTLVFYAGKAPKGIRTCWIMNEYRLPHSEAQKYQKTEISICRVYKRGANKDHLRHPPSSKVKKQLDKCETHNKSSNITALTFQESALRNNRIHEGNIDCSIANSNTLSNMTAPIAQFAIKSLLEGTTLSVNQLELMMPTITPSSTSSIATVTVDELNNQESFLEQGNHLLSGNQQLQVPLSIVSTNPLAAISEKPWEWNPLHEVERDCAHHYKI